MTRFGPFLSRFARTLLFLLLRMFRPLLRLVMVFAVGLCLLMTMTLLVVGFYRGWAEPFLRDAGVAFLAAFVCSALTWYYDVLLMKLTPEGYQLVLWS
jgi:hypothetical protein